LLALEEYSGGTFRCLEVEFLDPPFLPKAFLVRFDEESHLFSTTDGSKNESRVGSLPPNLASAVEERDAETDEERRV
jgi:hypothetical protein